MLGQRGPLYEFHREVLLALVLADLVDRHDVGMVEIGGRLGLGAEALDVARRGERAAEDHLESDDPIERRLPGLVDDCPCRRGRFPPAARSRRSSGPSASVADAVRIDVAVASIPPAIRSGEAIRSMRSTSAKKARSCSAMSGWLIEQLLAVGDLAGLDRLHVRRNHRVERAMRHRGIVRRRHGIAPMR